MTRTIIPHGYALIIRSIRLLSKLFVLITFDDSLDQTSFKSHPDSFIMVLLQEMVTNRLRLYGISELKRVKRLPNDAYSFTSQNFPEHTKRSGLFFVSFSIVLITILSILFLYCFLVEYRLAKIITKMNDFEKRQKPLEELVKQLMSKNAMENSKYLKHGKLKQPNEIQNMPKGDLELRASEDHNIKVSSSNPYASPRSEDKRNNTSIIDNTDNTSNSETNIISPSKNVFTKIRIRRSRGKNRNTVSERQPKKTSGEKSSKHERNATHLPLIHLENNSTSVREKQSEANSQIFNFWREADWVDKFRKKHFYFNPFTGHVGVQRSGAYLIYVQIVYHDAIGRWSAGIDVDGNVRAKCLESEQLRDIENYSQENHGVYKQCSISTVVHLIEKQSVSIKCMYGHRTILSQPEFTFWGMVKLA